MGDSSKKITLIQDILNGIFEESHIPPHKIRREVERISDIYSNGRMRGGDIKPEIYALYFMPEHLPKVMFVFHELITIYPALMERIKGIYDLGCGVGTAATGIRLLSGIDRPFTLVDNNREMLKFARRILNIFGAEWYHTIEADYMERDIGLKHPSLYVFMNTLSENVERLSDITGLIHRIIEKNKDNIVIIIEPVSDRGKEIVIGLRTAFGKDVLMPCIGRGDCPLIRRFSDICRFAIDQQISHRLETVVTARHRMAKFYYLVIYGGIIRSADSRYRVLSYPVSRQYGFDLKICDQKDITSLKIKSRGSGDRRFIKKIGPNTIMEIACCEGIDLKRPLTLEELGMRIINSPSDVITLLEHIGHL